MSVTACLKLAPLSIKAQLFGLALVGSSWAGKLVHHRQHRVHQVEESAERVLCGTGRALLGLQFVEGLLHAFLVRSFLYAHINTLSDRRLSANSAHPRPRAGLASVAGHLLRDWQCIKVEHDLPELKPKIEPLLASLAVASS